jgi:ATP-dependent Lon protease
MPDDVREQAERELDRLERVGEGGGGEGQMIRTYLDWLVSVPWSERTDEVLDPVKAREVLDADHAGLDDVKDRIVEYIAVRKLRVERGIDADKKAGAILTLIGPPGTGKTSIGESIAARHGREFVRMSLGGVRDEAEIRGHRRTYIGALPGRLVRALRDARTMNPVIMLDEVDKVGADWRGDPSSALLEVLDPRRTTRSATTTSTSSSTCPRSCSSPRRTWPRRSPARCWTAWRSSTSTATPSRRRPPSPATTCSSASASATACARTR